MNNFVKSEFESSFLGINIFRSVQSILPEPALFKKFALDNQVDLFRIKVDSKDEKKMNSAFELFGMPYFYSHSLLNVKVDYSTLPVAPCKNQNLSFELYEGTPQQRNRFYHIVYNGMFNDPIGYHKTPLINSLIPIEKEAACYATYYTNNYEGSKIGNIGFIMKKDNIDVGAFVFEIINETMHTSMAAILPTYRSLGLFHDMKVFRQKYCNDNKISMAYTGSRLNNYNTPSVLLKNGYSIYNVEHVFHITPLLNNNVLEETIKFPVPKKVSALEILSFLYNIISNEINNAEIKELIQKDDLSISLETGYQNLQTYIFIQSFSFPIITKSELMLVFKYCTKEQTGNNTFGYVIIKSTQKEL